MLLIIPYVVYLAMALFALGMLARWVLRCGTASKTSPAEAPHTELATTMCLGLAFLIPLLSLISLFHAIDGAVHIALVGAILLFARPRRTWEEFKRSLKQDAWLDHRPAVALGVIGFLWVAFLSAGGPRDMLDTPAYHMVTVSWIREYGVVPGLANLMDRLGINSSWHVLCAFIEQGPFRGGSTHVAGLLMYTIFTLACLPGLSAVCRGGLTVSGVFQSLAFIVFLWGNEPYLSSLSTDWPWMVLTFVGFLECIKSIEFERGSGAAGKARCAVLLTTCVSALAVTIKLTALPFILLPLVAMLVAKRWSLRTVMPAFLIAIFIIIPFLARNVVLSGYLVYPSTAFDWFAVDWKVPPEDVHGQSSFIKEWGYYDYDAGNPKLPTVSALSLTERASIWFQTWVIEGHGSYHCVDLMVFLLISLSSWLFILWRGRRPKTSFLWPCAVLALVPLGGLVVALASSPNPRFIWGFLAFFSLIPVSIALARCCASSRHTAPALRAFVCIGFGFILLLSGKNYGLRGLIGVGYNGYGVGWASLLTPRNSPQPPLRTINSLNGAACGAPRLDLLTASDIIDISTLCSRLSSAEDPLSRSIWTNINANSRRIILDTACSSELRRQTLAESINELLIGPSLFDEDRFKSFALSEATRRLLNVPPRWNQSFIELNRMLLADAYPTSIASNTNRNWVETDLLWDSPLPCSDRPHPYLSMRGESIKAGYRVTQPRTAWIKGWSDEELAKAISMWGISHAYVR